MIGPQVQNYTQACKDWVSFAPIVKSIDNVSPLVDAKDNAIRVFRAYVGDGIQSLDTVYNAIISRLAGYRHPNLYVEVLNEPDQWSAAVCDYYNIIVPRLHAASLKVAGPSWGTGNPELRNWDYWRERRWSGLDAIALHAYWGNRGFTPWHALRHARLWIEGDPKILITECGRDAIEGGGKGWKASGLTREQYANELVDYDKILKTQPYVIGATPFIGGPNPEWRDFDTDDIGSLIKAAGNVIDDNQTNQNNSAVVAVFNDVELLKRQMDILVRGLYSVFGQTQYVNAADLGRQLMQTISPMLKQILTAWGSPPTSVQDAIVKVWPAELWHDAASIAYLESRWDTNAENNTTNRGPCGTRYQGTDGGWYSTEISRGLFQLNICAHSEWANEDLSNPLRNSQLAYELYQNGGWAHWYVSARQLGLI